MPARRTNQRYLLWLALGTILMAAAMAVLLVLQLTQQQAIRKSGDLRSDSITALTFQLEREFLRLRQSMELASRSKPPLALDELRLRSDIFASRFQLMHDTPSTTALQEREEYTKVMPRLEALVTQVDRLLQNGHSPQPHELRPLLAELNELGPDVQELTMAATSHIAGLLEEQESRQLHHIYKLLFLKGFLGYCYRDTAGRHQGAHSEPSNAVLVVPSKIPQRRLFRAVCHTRASEKSYRE